MSSFSCEAKNNDPLMLQKLKRRLSIFKIKERKVNTKWSKKL